jgi:hypothetical protein
VTPVWIVCEDGSEYHSRFARFLANQFTFVRADCAAALLQLAHRGAAGAIVDLAAGLASARPVAEGATPRPAGGTARGRARAASAPRAARPDALNPRAPRASP